MSRLSDDYTPSTPSGTSASDATTGSKGIVQLAGDLAGTAASPTVPGLATKAATDLSNVTPSVGRTALGLGTAATHPATDFAPGAQQGIFYATAYGVAANAKTVNDGAMTSGSAVLTSATAAFTAGDVGKVIVVNNATGSGSHLWTTISGYTSATQVTLAATATATISATVVTFGTNDTTNAQAALTAAAAVGGKLILAPTPMLITSALTCTGPVTIEGQELNVYYGPATTTTPLSTAALNVPTQPPYLTGSVIVQAGQNQDGLTITATGVSVNLKNVGVHFAGWFKNTGHGINVDTTALSTYKNTGMMGFRWSNVIVLGHDGSHYGIRHVNAMYGVIDHVQTFGGGGITLEVNCASNQAYGNTVYQDIYVMRLCGPASGVYMNKLAGQSFYLLVWNRVQVNGGGINSTFYSPWNSALTDATGWGIDDNSRCILVYAEQLDLEFGEKASGNVRWSISPSSNLQGATVPTVSGTQPSGAWAYAPDTFAFNPDNAPRGWIDPNGMRRINLDGSISLDTTEFSGSSLWLLNDATNGNFSRWGISTDGSGVMTTPGLLDPRFKTPVAAAGAAAGTGPPSPAVFGGDMSGTVLVGTGASTTTGVLATVTLARTYASPPVVVITPNNAATAALGLAVTAQTASGFTVSATNAPTASQSIATSGINFSWVAFANAGPSTPVVWDDFGRADNPTTVGAPVIGPSPTTDSGSVWGITSGKLKLQSGQGNVIWDASKADVTFRAVWTNGSTGQVFRYANATSFWRLHNNQMQKIGGSGTISMPPNCAIQAGDEVVVRTLGTLVQVFRNGVNVLQTTDAYNQTATKHGFWGFTGGGAQFDNVMIT